MALLTEEQINDILDITNVDGDSFCGRKLIEWNKKQTTQQFEPDWNNAPEKAVQAVINSFWVDKNGDTFGVYKTYYDRPAPVIKPHPHAEMMAKYAEVATRRVDPWVEFELNYCDEDWIALETPTFFDTHLEYRHIGDNK